MTTLEKIRAEIEQNAYPIVHGVNNHEKGMTLYGILQVLDKYAEQEPCDDVVSRQEVLKAVDFYDGLNHQHFTVENLREDIERLPSVRPQEQTGRWIETEYHRWRCSVCREKGMSEWDNIHNVRTNFCSECGARMVEPQESDDI